MKYKERNGTVYEQDTAQDKLLRNLYSSAIGRILLRPLISPCISRAAGIFLDCGLSSILIKGFVKKNKIQMEPYIKRDYHSFNDFFTREIKPTERMIDYGETHLVSPSDGKVSAYHLGEVNQFKVKESCYTIESLLKNKKLAQKFKNGYAVIIRLTVDDYHRYCYPSDGNKSANYFIPGVLHTVNPTACESTLVYKENAREYTLLATQRFGTILQMEVGALMVGRITNYEQECCVKKGEEKGRFEFGGSTIILLLQEGKVRLRGDLVKNTKDGYETIVKMGELIGENY